ncbi:MAG: hypothetical protein L3K07_01400 [Thermoplasmata archaeon]|nr:hypothetical protein [Thermoplasmata archaeon]
MATAPAEEEPTPPPRRDSWSLRQIVEEVAGQPLEAFQDPSRAPHPYVHLKATHAAATKPRAEPEEDPVARVYPPLVGEVGRKLHGPEAEHHRETLEALEEYGPRVTLRPPGPSRRPERIYLHYLLLHLDRLSDRALEYLRAAVREELEHRASASTEPPAPPPSF